MHLGEWPARNWFEQLATSKYSLQVQRDNYIVYFIEFWHRMLIMTMWSELSALREQWNHGGIVSVSLDKHILFELDQL